MHIRRVYDAFGPRRILGGTDYSRLTVPYGEAARLVTEALDFLSDENRRWVMGRAAAEWLRWPLQGKPPAHPLSAFPLTRPSPAL